MRRSNTPFISRRASYAHSSHVAHVWGATCSGYVSPAHLQRIDGFGKVPLRAALGHKIGNTAVVEPARVREHCLTSRTSRASRASMSSKASMVCDGKFGDVRLCFAVFGFFRLQLLGHCRLCLTRDDQHWNATAHRSNSLEVHEASMRHACDTHATRMRHACDTHAARMQHACGTHQCAVSPRT